MSIDDDDDDLLELGLGLSIGGFKTKEEPSTIFTAQHSANLRQPSCSSSSSSSVNIHSSSIVGTKTTVVHSVSPNANRYQRSTLPFLISF